MPLTHKRYDIVDAGIGAVCPYQHVLTNGTLDLFDSYMRINHNRLDISTKVNPWGIDEHTIFSCPQGTFDLQSLAHWRTLFMYLHQSEMVDNQMVYLFTPEHWKYTGNQILAEAIFSGRTAYSGFLTGDTWLVMLHRPGGN
ncbi:MAG: hypothetical protein HZB51_11185 [Chloroflexi bacterium]|nr:hypothetical protein [Chloroflexota bacterium]